MTTQREINVNGGVLVGHDGSKFSALAVAWALAYARDTGATLTIVRVWSLSTAPRPETWAPGYVPPLDDYAAAVLQALTADVAKLVADVPQVSVSFQAVHGKSALRMIEASPRAAILVVGRRGMG
ncbi:MAG: universal stress protein, partial [Antricoccus sp.]